MLSFFKTSYQKVKQALSKTRSVLGTRISTLFSKPWNEETLDLLEQILYEADLGSLCVEDFIEHLKKELKKSGKTDLKGILELLKARALDILTPKAEQSQTNGKEKKPFITLFIGINGSGKTTSLAKIGLHYQKLGKSVLLGAGDTFRAAAIDQLSLWGERLGVQVVKATPGADPAAVAYDAVFAGKSRNTDVVLIDTAGRLQNKTDLMQELVKIKRTCHKLVEEAPHEVLLVLDATMGQNGIDQARVFHEHIPLTGIVLTKLDGSAKGGIILSIYKELGIPVKWIGVGEGAEDLLPFEPKAYVDALFEQ